MPRSLDWMYDTRFLSNCRNSTVGVVTRLRARNRGTGFDSRYEREIFLFSKRFSLAPFPPPPLTPASYSIGNLGCDPHRYVGHKAKLTTFRSLLPQSRVFEAIIPLPCSSMKCTGIRNFALLRCQITLFNLLAIRNNTIYKLMWWLYKVRYDTMYKVVQIWPGLNN